MKLVHILAFLAMCLVFTPSSSIEISDKRLKELREIINNTDLAKMPGGDKLIAAAIREIRGVDSCDPNVCFAIDGSASMGKKDFELQKQFVAIIAAIVGAEDGAQFAAVQYGLSNKKIRNLRGNADNFLLLLERAKFAKARRTFIGAGLAYCVSQLGRRRGEPSKIVILGDGRSSYGDVDGLLGPGAIADAFRGRSPANRVCTVAVGFSDTSLFEEIADDEDSVLEVGDWPRVLNILRELVRDICYRPPDF